MLLTILIFVIVLGLLVFVHEAGHFLVAKRSGMEVHEFGFGFPPRLVGIQKVDGKWRVVWRRAKTESTNTIYSVNWIPLGGFVKILGENNDAENNPKSFINRPFLPRFLTLAAGVLMNVVLAWILLSIGFATGLPVASDGESLPHGSKLTDPRVAIVDLMPNSPAAKAGLQPGDTIIKLNGQDLGDLNQVRQFIFDHKGEKIVFEVSRMEQPLSIEVQSEANPPADSGPTGVGLATVGELRLPWYQALWQGLLTTFDQLKAIVVGLVGLFSSGQGFQNIGGPVKIAQLTGQVARLGFIPLLQFVAFLSLNLALLNSLPIPALDGGRMLFLVIEKIRGRRNNPQWEQTANAIGFVLLLLLMVVVTARDVISTTLFKNIIG
jgi:regulator of sigma E protease